MITAAGSNFSQGIAYTQQGKYTPEDSMTNYVSCDHMVKNADTDLLDADVAKQARQASTDLKSQFEKQADAAFKAVPKTPEAARQVMLNVLMCGTFAGAIDRAMHNVLHETPSATTPAEGIDPELHEQMGQMLGAAPGEIEMFMDEVKAQGEGALVPVMNMMRSQADELIDQSAALAGSSSTKEFATNMLHVFQAGYMAGASTAELKGQDP
jgi:hypothetical protein